MTGEHSVLHVVTRLNVGGVTQQVVTLAAGMPPEFPSKILFGDPEPDEEDMSDVAVRLKVASVHLPGLRRRISPLSDVRILFRLYRIFRTERPTVVSSTMFKARLLASVAARLARVPVVVETFNGTLFHGYFRSFAQRLLLVSERFIGRVLIHHAIATTESDARSAIEHGVVEPEGVTHIPYGFDLKSLADEASQRSGKLRAELGWDGSSVVVGIVGRLTPIKGHRYFLEAVSRWFNSGNATDDVKFLIVGDGELRAELESLARDLKIDDRVHFTGTRRDMSTVYADIDVLAVSSLNEGTCIVIAEAMACGCAVVATNVGGIPELVDPEVTGLLVPAQDATALAGALARLVDDSSLRSELADAARTLVLENLTVDRMVAQTLSLYRRLANA